MMRRTVVPLLGFVWIASLGCSDVVGGIRGSGVSNSETISKVDLLFVVDGSPGAAEAQRVLASSASEILLELINPRCVDELGGHEVRSESPSTPCTDGLTRRFPPVRSLHVGVVSSNLGSLGDAPCDGPAATAIFGNDKGRLVTRGAEAAGFVSVIQNGFVAWSGEDDGLDYETLERITRGLILGVGEAGCPYPMPLEAAARFLMDPAPFDQLALVDGVPTPTSVDARVLSQRKAFLRDDSMLAVVILAPSNDCSVRPGRQSAGLFSRPPGETAAAATVCATDPDHPCCYACDEGPAGTCPVDPACIGAPKIAAEQDPLGMRCADQKRRFGASFLYPVSRYVNALQLVEIDRDAFDFTPRDTYREPNPLFAGARARDGVNVTLLSGVPWEAIAQRPDRYEDGTRTVNELTANGAMDAVAGDPDRFSAPTNPFQIESLAPRDGILPGNYTNGGDRPADGSPQYACIFPLAIPSSTTWCSSLEQTPICLGDTQTHAFATPGTRVLGLAASLQSRAVVGSACPAKIDEGSFYYGYRPALRDLVERIAPSLVKASK